MSTLLLARVVKHRALKKLSPYRLGIEDERRLLKSLREMRVLLDRFNPGMIARFHIIYRFSQG